MIVDCDVKWVKELDPASSVIKQALRYKDRGRYRLDLRALTDDEIDKLVTIANKIKSTGYKALETSVKSFRLMKVNPSGVKVPTLKLLETALIEHFLANAPNKWVFKVDDGQRVPYYVAHIKYTPRTIRGSGEDQETIPARLEMKIRSAEESETVTWREHSFPEGEDAITVIQHLKNHDLITETPDLVAAYEEEMKLYNEIAGKVGDQYAATGTGYIADAYWWSQSTVQLERDGNKSKVVIDTPEGSDEEDDEDGRGRRRRRRSVRERGVNVTTNNSWWNIAADPKRRGGGDDDDDDLWYSRHRGREVSDAEANTDNIVVLPEHPWLRVFDLGTQQFMDIHVNNLEPWPFDDKAASKLVLPPEHITVLNALASGSDRVMEDIIRGKTGGTIVLCTGDPGTGKTLSAEVMAEKMHKPLYTVQCSQLGLNPQELEEQLGIVLKRASRWKCILLIDEADVYIHSRGEDIVQNAIVGVWLRVLEYYRGVLFMTSNRATQIDDAIASRATAWIRYERPNPDDLYKIWATLLAHYEMETPTELIPRLIKLYGHASGRNVKNMIKLSQALREAGVPGDTVQLFKLAGKYIDVEPTEKPAKPSGQWDYK